jgi:hypothetical protein
MGFLDAAHAAHVLKIELGQILAGQQVVRGPDGGFHDTAGGGEDVAGPGGSAEGPVEVLFRQASEVDAVDLHHAVQLPRGDHGVHIGHTRLGGELGARGLELLGRAGHHGDHEDILGVDILLLREIALDGRAHHLLWGLASGDVRKKLGIVDLRVLDPRRAAGREKGQLLPLLDPLHQLRAFFHDSEVRGEVRVEDLAESHAPQRRGHLAGDIRPGGKAEEVAKGDADGGSRLRHEVLLPLLEGLHYLFHRPHLVQRARGARQGALPAVHARGLAQVHLEWREHHGVETAAREVDGGHALDLLADAHAAPAEYALVGLADD